MTKYEIVPATLEHAVELSRTMREADREEAWAAGHMRPYEALVGALRASMDARTGLADGKVLCMFGVARASFLSRTTLPWMLGSADLPKHARAFLRGSREYVAEIGEKHENLINFVDARNELAIKWLSWLGFTVADEPEPYGRDQLPFHRFHLEKTPCASQVQH